MTLKSGSKIQRKAMVLSTVGTIHGRSTAARTKRWNRTIAFSNTASQIPSTHFTAVAMPVYKKKSPSYSSSKNRPEPTLSPFQPLFRIHPPSCDVGQHIDEDIILHHPRRIGVRGAFPADRPPFEQMVSEGFERREHIPHGVL